MTFPPTTADKSTVSSTLSARASRRIVGWMTSRQVFLVAAVSLDFPLNSKASTRSSTISSNNLSLSRAREYKKQTISSWHQTTATGPSLLSPWPPCSYGLQERLTMKGRTGIGREGRGMRACQSLPNADALERSQEWVLSHQKTRLGRSCMTPRAWKASSQPQGLILTASSSCLCSLLLSSTQTPPIRAKKTTEQSVQSTIKRRAAGRVLSTRRLALALSSTEVKPPVTSGTLHSSLA
jgi:hypothetical protein